MTIYRNPDPYRDSKQYRGTGSTAVAVTKTHTADAKLVKAPTKSHTADARPISSGTTANHSADAVLIGGHALFHTADAVLVKKQSVLAHTADAVLRRPPLVIVERLDPNVPQTVTNTNYKGQDAVIAPWTRAIDSTNLIRDNPSMLLGDNEVINVGQQASVQNPQAWFKIPKKVTYDDEGQPNQIQASQAEYVKRGVSPDDQAYEWQVEIPNDYAGSVIPFADVSFGEEYGWQQEYFVLESQVGLPFMFSSQLRRVSGGGRTRVSIEALDADGTILASAASAFSTATTFGTRASAGIGSLPADTRFLRVSVRYRPGNTPGVTDVVQARNSKLVRGTGTTWDDGVTADGNTLFMVVSTAYDATRPTITVDGDWTLEQREDNAGDVTTAIYSIVEADARSGVELVSFDKNRQGVVTLIEAENVQALDTSGSEHGKSEEPNTGSSGTTSQEKAFVVGVVATSSQLGQRRMSSTGPGTVNRLARRSSGHDDPSKAVTHSVGVKYVIKKRGYRIETGLAAPRPFAGAIVAHVATHDAPPPPPPPPELPEPQAKGVLPSLFISVYLRPGDGPRRTLGVDAASDQIKFTDVANGGYETCEFRIAPYEYEQFDVYRPMAHVEVHIANGVYRGRKVWEGWLKQPTQNSDGTYRCFANGYKSFWEEDDTELCWQARGVQEWITDQDEVLADAGFKGAPSISAEQRKQAMGFRVNKGSEINQGQKRRMAWYQDGFKVQRVAGRLDPMTAMPGGAASNDWALWLERAGAHDFPYNQGEMIAVKQLTQNIIDAAGGKFDVSFLAPGNGFPRSFIAFRLDRVGKSTDDLKQTWGVDFLHMRVNGDAYRVKPQDWDRYDVRQVLLDLCDRSEFEPTDVAHQSNAGGNLVNILPLWWQEGPVSDLVEKLAVASGFKWAVWGLDKDTGKPQVEFRGWQQGNTVWRVYAYSSKATAIPDITPSEDQYSDVEVRYRLGGTAGTRTARARVIDPDTGDFVFAGIAPPRRRVFKMALDDPQPNANLAEASAAEVARDLAGQQFGGTLELASAVDIEDELEKPAYLIRSGHLVTIPDWPGGGRSFRVYGTEKTETGVTLQVGRTPTKVERMLWYQQQRRARKGRAFSGLG